MIKIYYSETAEDAGRAAAEVIASLVKEKPDCVLGLATGSSPIGMYTALAEKCDRGEISFKAVKSANLDSYKTAADLAGKKAAVEGGSAGASYAASVTDEDKITKASSQIEAFPELASGAVDFIVCDIVLAKNICGKGDYASLTIVEDIVLESEIYAIGFKKGSDLTAKVNAAIEELFENGKLAELAEKYGFENVLSLEKEID